MAQKFYLKTVALLRSSKFFYLTLAVYAFETAWIALSGLYPMAYDEEIHVGTIQLYAHKWLPFWHSQPPGADYLGIVFRDPSYMYHYLMSFPYRILTHFVHSQTVQVLILRFTSLVLFGVGIIIFRRLLLKMHVSRGVTHSVLALFVLTPLIPFLAAQINYDNLLFPLTGLFFLLALRLQDEFKDLHSLNIVTPLQFAALGLFSSLVKFSFLPILLAGFIWLLYLAIRLSKQPGVSVNEIIKHLWESHKKASVVTLASYAILLVLACCLFTERYGINTLRYHNPVPACHKVMSMNNCMQYSPWRRDYLSHQDKLRGLITPIKGDPISYTLRDWLPQMNSQLFFTINGPYDGFSIGNPLVLPLFMGSFVAIGGAIVVVAYRKYLRAHYRLGFIALTGLIYVVVLWEREYGAFLYNGYAVAVHARYLIYFLPVIYAVYASALVQLLRKLKYVKAGVFWLAMAILITQGGGSEVFIVRSNPTWWWPNKAVISTNQAVQNILQKIILGV